MSELDGFEKAHFIGIGGVSMSALAHALHRLGTEVTGSDIRESERVESLRALGIRVAIGHSADNIGDADLVIYTTAIPDHNPELVEARSRRLPTWHRSRLLAAFVQGRRGLAVAGTHGKTTTTAMLGYILAEAGLDPTIFLGGISRDFDTNYRVGESDIVVFEADESDASFHRYEGSWQVITNIEADHLDQHNDFATVQQVFSDFIGMGDPNGFLVYGADSPPLAAMADGAPGETVSFALQTNADIRAENIRIAGANTRYNLVVNGNTVGDFSLRMPGRHYVEDALAAIGMAICMHVDPSRAAAELEQFEGTGRRFELRYESDQIQVYDDYAHHPTEVRAVLRAAREGFDDAHITAVFQPHLYSRTKSFMDEFAAAFDDASSVIITAIYGAREQPIPGVSAADLARRIRTRRPAAPVAYIDEADAVLAKLAESTDETDIIITIGAGDITDVSRRLAQLLKERG